jgi:hypothetical protein
MKAAVPGDGRGVSTSERRAVDDAQPRAGAGDRARLALEPPAHIGARAISDAMDD